MSLIIPKCTCKLQIQGDKVLDGETALGTRGEMQVSLPLGQNEDRECEYHFSRTAVCAINPVSSLLTFDRLVSWFPRIDR